MAEAIKILCIEDEKDLRENISTILQSEGFNIIQAENGREGYEKFLSDKPNLVLCDINMPIMDGRQLLDKLNKECQNQLTETPFLFLTAFGQKDDKLVGIKLGADDYIVKPVDFDILLTTIQNKLKKSSDQKSATKAKLIDLCEKVSNLIPKEIQQPLQNIITLSATLKKETHGEIDKKYVDYAGKIYLAALKLNAQITKALDKDKIINEADALGNYVAVADIINEVKSAADNQDVTYEVGDNLPQLAVQSALFVPVLVNYLKQHELAETKNIKMNVFEDYMGNLVISVSGKALLPVFSEELEEAVNELGGEFRIQDDGDETYHIISLPKYLLKHQ